MHELTFRRIQKVLTITKKTQWFRRNKEGKIKRQLAKPGLSGKWPLKRSVGLHGTIQSNMMLGIKGRNNERRK